MRANRLGKLLGTLVFVAAFMIGSQQLGMIYAAGAGGNSEPSSLDADVVEYDMKTGMVTAEGNVLFGKPFFCGAGSSGIG